MKISKLKISTMISFAAGFIQSFTFIIVFILYRNISYLDNTQKGILIALAIINEILGYVLMRISFVLLSDYEVKE